MTIPMIHTEQARLGALLDLRLLETPPSESFDRITRLASRIFALPIAAVSLTDSDRQWFKSRVGVAHYSIPRREAPCAQVAKTCGSLVIEDLRAHPDYHNSPLAQSGIRFYAGAPLVTRDGFGLGAMCVLGTEPRTATPMEISSLNDLAAMVMAQIELQHAFGRVDPVSGLPNRTQFLDDLDDIAMDRGVNEVRLATVIDLIAAEQLNHILRVMGPGPIDAMVKSAARNLSEMIGPGRKAYHVGPSQLAVVSPAGLNKAGYIALMKSREDRIRALAGPSAVGSVAIGAATFRLGATSGSDVLRIAQSAAQDARTSGELFSFYSSRQDLAYRRRFTLLQEFEIAILNPEQFSLVYQPRIDLVSSQCVGAEALMRWHHPNLGLISPAEFVPLIEQMSLSGPMTAWVVGTAIAQLSKWRMDGMDLPVSINVSPANLREADFAGMVLRTLAEHQVPTGSLELEITETAIMNNAGHALAQLEELARAGIRLAIDDFGTGYSSLSYLQKLPIKVVKIDRSFMQDLETNPKQMAFVSMMIDMSKHLGHRVVAEGIETERVLAQLRMTACDEVQGYLFARPMSADQFKTWAYAHSLNALNV